MVVQHEANWIDDYIERMLLREIEAEACGIEYLLDKDNRGDYDDSGYKPF